jgi:hypothetical protein
MGRLMPPEREVDCPCAEPLQRSVFLDPTGWNQRVTACMRCGGLSFVEVLVEEPRPHDVRALGTRVLELALQRRL